MNTRITGRTQGLVLIFALALLVSSAAVANASNITYTLNRVIGAGSVTGTVTTDGTVGGLTFANVVDWNVVLYTPAQGSFSLFGPGSGNNSSVWSTGADLTATSTQLLFNFSGSDFGVFALQQGLFSGNHYYCAGTQLAQTNGYCDQGESVVPISVSVPGWLNVPQSGNLVIGTAGSTSTPEPGSLALLGSGIIGAFGFIRRKLIG